MPANGSSRDREHDVALDVSTGGSFVCRSGIRERKRAVDRDAYGARFEQDQDKTMRVGMRFFMWRTPWVVVMTPMESRPALGEFSEQSRRTSANVVEHPGSLQIHSTSPSAVSQTAPTVACT